MATEVLHVLPWVAEAWKIRTCGPLFGLGCKSWPLRAAAGAALQLLRLVSAIVVTVAKGAGCGI